MLKLTKKAAEEIKKASEEYKENEKTEDFFLRIGVKGGGCSGFSYCLTFEKSDKLDEKHDIKYEQHGVEFVMDDKSAIFLDETTVDYHTGIEQRGFKFENPNAQHCGCGMSFRG